MYTSVEGFDHGIYDSAWVSEQLWKFKVLPSIGCEISEDSITGIREKIDELISSDRLEKCIKDAKAYAWMNQGKSAETIVSYLESLQQAGSPETEVKK